MTISKAVTTRINELLVQKNMSWYKLEQESLLSKGTIVCVQYSKYKSVNLSTLITIILAITIFFFSYLCYILYITRKRRGV